ncbi:hypothetical protein D3C76_421150 [compost metagenome]|uniref:hypothetical protein n=1 Tax=Pseudomonas sp. BF-R-30 TaxID=2832384 RepID=UPI000FBC0E17|nr:hypothetical protein [Pseudomonas sp. BF-R-30]
MSDNKSVDQLRAIFFGQTLTEEAGCAATGPALARWGDTWWAKRTGRAIPETFNHKWPDFLTGRLPRNPLRAALIAAFPLLQTVLDDPLWPLLQRLVHPQEDTGCWAAQLRLNGRPFRYYSAARLIRLCGVPDWRRLAGLLALMGSERPGDVRSQSWLRLVIALYVLCACLDLPARTDPLDLYGVLDEANRLDKFGPLKGWPNSAADFQHKLRRLQRIRQRLQARGWLVGWNLKDRLLFWHLLWNRATLTRLLNSAPTVDLTRRDLLKQSRHWFRQAQRDQVSFAQAPPGAWDWCDPSRGNTVPYAWVMPAS